MPCDHAHLFLTAVAVVDAVAVAVADPGAHRVCACELADRC